MNNLNNQNPSPEKKQVEVKIGNIKYNLSTTESEEYINGIAKYVNNKIDELSSSHKGINKDSIPFFLTMALNIADDLFKQRKQFTKSSKSLKTLEENILKINENTLNIQNLKSSLKEKDLEILSLKDELSNSLNKKNQEINSLQDDIFKISSKKNQEINSLKNELEKKHAEISLLKETISSLENKLKDFSSIEDESLNLLYEKDQEIEILNKKIKELSLNLNISK